MKMIIALAALVAVAAAVPVHPTQDKDVVVVKETIHENNGLPQAYGYGYELSDGQSRQEQASFKEGRDEDGKPVPTLILAGSFSFVGHDGQQYTVQYTADETGFHPSGAHIPV